MQGCFHYFRKTEGDAEDEFVDQSPRLFQLGVALFDALISNSEVVCYFAMILNHLVTASILTMFYPISVFLWAMLSVPRPTKAYWVTIITYTEVKLSILLLYFDTDKYTKFLFTAEKKNTCRKRGGKMNYVFHLLV